MKDMINNCMFTPISQTKCFYTVIVSLHGRERVKQDVKHV